MTLTNAQAALQAAATVHSGSKGYADTTTVTAVALRFKQWLDDQDRKDTVEETGLTSSTRAVTPNWHRQHTNPGGYPVCSCGWDPRDHYRNLNGEAAARGLIRAHITRHTPEATD